MIKRKENMRGKERKGKERKDEKGEVKGGRGREIGEEGRGESWGGWQAMDSVM